jgi:hypothetical protein
VEDGEVSRVYYTVSFDQDNPDKVDSLNSTQSVPDAIRPKLYDEDGKETGFFVSDYAELQNFANWFSFYRRRSLTEKATLASTIDELEMVNVGIYTLHRADLTGMDWIRTGVQPIKTATNAIIVDNKDSGFTSTVGWHGELRESSREPEWVSSSMYLIIHSKDDTKDDYPYNTLCSTKLTYVYGKWTPAIPQTDEYKLFAWWSCYAEGDQKAKFIIHHANGEEIKYFNQRAAANDQVTVKDNCKDSDDIGCCGYWVPIGTYTFNQGTEGYIQAGRHCNSTGTSTSVDAVKLEPVDGSIVVDSTDSLLDSLYNIDPMCCGTPLRDALYNIGCYFDQDDGLDGDLGDSPYLCEDDGGACQQSFTIVMSDGHWTPTKGYFEYDELPAVGNQDGGKGAPYEDTYSNTLADVAMKYYDTDLSSSLPDQTPANSYDQKSTQHMVTYTVSFGPGGTIDMTDIDNNGVPDDPGYDDDPYFLNPLTPRPVWPDPIGDPPSNTIDGERIDDFWHASVNGRGQFFKADNSENLIQSLQNIFSNIASRTSSGASVSVNGDELSTSFAIYQSSYISGDWLGDIAAYRVNTETGEILREEDDVLWHATEKLQDQDWSSGRKIITFDGSAGIPFRYSSLARAQQQALNNESDAVKYLRGWEVDGYRPRIRKMGDIVHSAPFYLGKDGKDNDQDGEVDEAGEQDGTIFVGGNDGMLHVINADTGEERFAYVPLHSFAYLYDLTQSDYNHRYYVDGTPHVKAITVDEEGKKKTVSLLVGGLGKGGQGVYALDVSDVENVSATTDVENVPATTTEKDEETTEKYEDDLATMALWEYPPVPDDGLEWTDLSADNLDNDGDGEIDEAGEYGFNFQDDDMGYTFSDPVVVESSDQDHPWIVIFGNGYESKSGKAVLYVLDALTGEKLSTLDTGVTGNNGLGPVTPVDMDNDDRLDFVYAGDLKGNLWKSLSQSQ